MRIRTTWVIALLAASFAALADENLWRQLRNDSHMVVLMRNAESSGNKDGADMLVWDSTGKCAGESTLTSLGTKQAEAIGAAFSEHGVKPVVISSPCVAVKKQHESHLVSSKQILGYGKGRLLILRGKRYFKPLQLRFYVNTGGKLPIVFVNHRPNIDAMTMELIKIGELLVGSITEDGEIEVLGKILVEQ